VTLLAILFAKFAPELIRLFFGNEGRILLLLAQGSSMSHQFLHSEYPAFFTLDQNSTV
jgi:hypothetical protein